MQLEVNQITSLFKWILINHIYRLLTFKS